VKQIAEGRDRQLAAGVQVVTIRMILRVAYVDGVPAGSGSGSTWAGRSTFSTPRRI
jgi:hypothetical protein